MIRDETRNLLKKKPKTKNNVKFPKINKIKEDKKEILKEYEKMRKMLSRK